MLKLSYFVVGVLFLSWASFPVQAQVGGAEPQLMNVAPEDAPTASATPAPAASPVPQTPARPRRLPSYAREHGAETTFVGTATPPEYRVECTAPADIQKNMVKVTYHFLEPDGWSRGSSGNGVRGWGETVPSSNGGFPVLAIIEVLYSDNTQYSIGLTITGDGKPSVRMP